MNRTVRLVLILLLIALVAIQFIRPERNLSNNNQLALKTKYEIPDSLENILQPACYDCHSNHTEYPWYWKIQPVAFFMDGHVNEGKRHVNFSEFAAYPINRQYRLFKEIADEVKSGDMPLTSYTLIHTDARLTEPQKSMIEGWALANRKVIEGSYPADSLKRKVSPPGRD